MNAQSLRVPGQGRIYKRDKVWYIDYWVDGRRKREFGGSKGAALEALAAKTTDVKRGILGFEKKQIVRFSDFADEYLDIKANGPKPKRSIRCIRGYVNYLKDFFGELPLTRITPESIEAYQRKRAQDDLGTIKKKDTLRRKVNGRSINRELAILRNIFNVARKKKLFRGDNPVSDIAFFPEPKRRHHVLSLDEYSKLINAADPRFRPIIQVAVQTGLRKGDILSIKRKDIDFKRNILTAWVSKTQEWQTFRMGEDLAATLRAIPEAGEYIFANPKTGTKWTDVKKWWEMAKTKSGIDSPATLRFHDLRANAGVRVEEKAGAYAAQVLLGHKSPKTTQLYLDLTPERAQAAAKALADFFKVGPSVGGTKEAQGQERKASSVAESTH
jgi:integrase